MTGQTPEYLRNPIPSLHNHLFGHQYINVLEPICCRTYRYQNSFFPNSVTMWNALGPELRGSETLSIFKNKILKVHRPEKKSLYDIHDPSGIKWIFQIRVGLSPLKSHTKNHNFKDTPNDTCQCSLNAETPVHFFLHCPNFVTQRQALFQILNPILIANNMRFLDDKNLLELLLYGHAKFKLNENQSTLKTTINYIRTTLRFSQN